MGDPKGFMKYAREGPKRKPVELRIQDHRLHGVQPAVRAELLVQVVRPR